jgi:hypothetical protein
MVQQRWIFPIPGNQRLRLLTSTTYLDTYSSNNLKIILVNMSWSVYAIWSRYLRYSDSERNQNGNLGKKIR